MRKRKAVEAPCKVGKALGGLSDQELLALNQVVAAKSIGITRQAVSAYVCRRLGPRSRLQVIQRERRKVRVRAAWDKHYHDERSLEFYRHRLAVVAPLWERGATCPEISQALGLRHPNSINVVLYRLRGMFPGVLPMRRPAMCPRIALDPQQAARLAKWWAAGESKAEIGRRLGIGYTCLSRLIDTLRSQDPDRLPLRGTRLRKDRLQSILPGIATQEDLTTVRDGPYAAELTKSLRLADAWFRSEFRGAHRQKELA
jgi:hypothetical protein